MNASLLSRIVAVVPERVTRAPSGTVFDPRAAASPHPERLAYLARQLTWTTPLVVQDRDSQQQLGLLNASGRPVQGPGEDGEGLAEEAEDAIA